jgi:hypothetical protein
MTEIEEKVKKIRQAQYGKDVRETIASGIEGINQKAEDVTSYIQDFQEKVESGYFQGEQGEKGDPGSIENVTAKDVMTNDNSNVQAVLDGLLDRFYPIGVIIEFNNNTNPNITIGGRWEQHGTGRVTVAADILQTEFNAIGKIGGELTHTLTVDEMPKHKHPIRRGWGGPLIVTNADKLRMFADTSVEYQNFSLSMNCDEAGGGLAHNNLQPYIVVNRWVRIS